jgi:hypothetical protein
VDTVAGAIIALSLDSLNANMERLDSSANRVVYHLNNALGLKSLTMQQLLDSLRKLGYQVCSAIHSLVSF